MKDNKQGSDVSEQISNSLKKSGDAEEWIINESGELVRKNTGGKKTKQQAAGIRLPDDLTFF